MNKKSLAIKLLRNQRVRRIALKLLKDQHVRRVVLKQLARHLRRR